MSSPPEVLDGLAPFRIPLTTRFRGVTERSGFLLHGPGGWAEYSPFPDYPPRVAARWWRAAIETATQAWPEPVRDRVPVNLTVPALEAEQAHALVRRSGCTTAKVKVGEGDDRARVEAVRDALGPNGKLRLDANGAWDVDQAAATLRNLLRYDLEYVEQPVATLEEMARLRRRLDVPLAADESVRLAPDPLHIAGIEAADLVVLKVQPLGGVRRALAVAEACGRPAVVSSAVETSIGLAAGLALAAALPELPYACGLGTLSLLAGDVVAEPFTPMAGMLAVRTPVPDPGLVARWAPDGASARQLEERFQAMLEAADQGQG